VTDRNELLRRTVLSTAGGVVVPGMAGCLSESDETPTESTTPGEVVVDREFTVTSRVRVTAALEERTRMTVDFDAETDFGIDVYTVRASEVGSFVDPGELSNHVEALTFLDSRRGSGQARLESGEWAVILDNSSEFGDAEPPAPDYPDAVVSLTVTTR
jgi:hypothetical protein